MKTGQPYESKTKASSPAASSGDNLKKFGTNEDRLTPLSSKEYVL